MTAAIPYMQRVLVPDKGIVEVYDTVLTWLQYNNWGITSSNQPTMIEAKYNADHRIISPRKSRYNS